MKIQHLKIENILGIKHLELTPGNTLTEISGDNGQGKTSVLEAIKAGTQGGHDATLLRQGAEKGEIVLVLDDGAELHKKVTADKSTLDLVKDGKKVPRASDTIKGLTDMMSVNPVDFLTAPKRDRVKVLLEAMPINADPKKLAQITGIPVDAQPNVDGLALIDLLHKQVYDNRTLTNRAVKEKDATINQLRNAMPEAPGGVEGDEDDLRAQIQAAQTAMHAEHKRIDDKLAGVRTESATKVQALKDEAQAKIDAIREDLQKALDAERATLADTEAKAGRVRQKATDACTAALQPLQAAVNAIAANRDAAAKRKVTQETLAKMEDELAELQADAERETKALAAIEKYKSELLDSLPIPGLEVRDGEVFRHGIPLDRLNTAQQVEIAIEVAKLRAGDLAICCVDRFECLSPETLAAFRERAAESNLQLFVTRVDSGDMKIQTS